MRLIIQNSYEKIFQWAAAYIVKKIKDHTIDTKFTTRHETTIDKHYFKPVIEGLFAVYNGGTASALRIEGIDICGKTGTVENFATVDGEKVKLQDHSVFLAFAPKENPKIAIAVYVENSGFGATWAVPIASLMIEKYLTGTVDTTKLNRKNLQKRMLETFLIE